LGDTKPTLSAGIDSSIVIRSRLRVSGESKDCPDAAQYAT
jgi:hypothetical protein